MTDTSAESFFTVEGDWFVPTWCSRGPWDSDACHAGPPTGLLARAAEIVLPEHRLGRLMVDLTRPVPMAAFRIEAEVLRAGRAVATAALRIVDADDRVIATARSLHIARADIGNPPSVGSPPPSLADSEPGPFPIRTAAHDDKGFIHSVEVRYPPGQTPEPGPTTLWLRTVPLLPDEAMSPFQRVCPLADCGNGISPNDHFNRYGPLNADVTLALHRDPVGEWIGSSAVSRWEANGSGLADALLFDEHGAIGRAIQMLLVSRL